MENGAKSKLQKWMRQQVLVEDDERGACKKITVRHTVNGKVGQEILKLKVPKLPDPGWFDEACDQIDSTVVDDAEPLGGVQTYIVQSFHEETEGKPTARYTIRETSASMDDPDSIESEPATKSGLLTQMMRHTEASARVSIMATGQIIASMRATISRQADMIEKLMADRQANFDTMEKLRSEEVERRIVLQREESSERMKGELLDNVKLLLPVVMNKIAGKPLLPAKASPTETLIQSLISSITPDQLGTLQSALTPAQMATLLEIFSNVQASEGSPVEKTPDAHA